MLYSTLRIVSVSLHALKVYFNNVMVSWCCKNRNSWRTLLYFQDPDLVDEDDRALQETVGIQLEDFVVVDDDLVTTEQQTLTEIIANHTNSHEEPSDDDDDDDNDILVHPPSKSDALQALSTLRSYFSFRPNVSKTLHDLRDIENYILHTATNEMRQMSLTEFFSE